MNPIKRIVATVSFLCLSATAFASPTKGTVMAYRELFPRSQTTYLLHLRGKEKTVIDVITEGEGRVNCTLFTHDGVQVGHDATSPRGCHIDIVPEKKADFSLNIDNENESPVKMTLLVQ